MLQATWKFLAEWSEGVAARTIPKEVLREVADLCILSALAKHDLRAPPSPVITCSDASESGGGACRTSSFTEYGAWAAATEMAREHLLGRDVLAVLVLGDDVGAALCALHALGVRWEAAASSPRTEIGMALWKRRWPDAKLLEGGSEESAHQAVEHVLEYPLVRLVIVVEVLDDDEVTAVPRYVRRLRGRHVETLWMTLRRAACPEPYLWQKGGAGYLSDRLFDGLGQGWDVRTSWPYNLEELVGRARTGRPPPRPQLGELDESCEGERRQGLPPFHTAGVGRRTLSKEDQEDARDFLCRRSVHVLIMGMFFGSALAHAGVAPHVPTLTQLLGGLWPSEEERLVKSLADLERRGRSLFEEHVLQAHRSAVFRGTDLRISSSIFRSPELLPRESVLSCRYIWKEILAYRWSGRHINELELKAVLNVVRWRARSSRAIGNRTLHYTDSQVCMGVLAHARSGSRPLHDIVRKLN
jgi:hypothetical protein